MIELEKLANMVDHTLLKADATKEGFEQLCKEADEYGFKMVAINSYPVAMCREFLKDSKVHVGAAIGFPLGQRLKQRFLKYRMQSKMGQMRLIM